MGGTRNRRLQAAAALLAGGLLVAACGSSKSSGSSSGSGAGSATTAASGGSTAKGAPLLIGEVEAQTGATLSGQVTDLADATARWASYVNGHGGINGHPVKIIVKDDANDPAKSTSIVHEFVTGDHVVAIFDGTGQDAAWASFVTQSKVPVISLNQAGDGFQYFIQPDYFANGTTVITILWGQMKAAQEAGAKTYGLVYCAEVPACAQAVPATQGLSKTIPISVVYSAKASNTQPDYTAVCLGAKSAGSQALFPAGVAPKRVADDCARQGFHPIWITSQGTVAPADVQDPNLSTVTGDLQDFPWMLDSTPAQKLFHQVEDPVLAKAQTQANVDFAYVGALLFQTAAQAGVTAANSAPAAQDILTGLYTIQNNNLGGLAPPLTFVQGKANPVKCVFLYGVKNGKYAATHGDQTFCQS